MRARIGFGRVGFFKGTCGWGINVLRDFGFGVFAPDATGEPFCELGSFTTRVLTPQEWNLSPFKRKAVSYTMRRPDEHPPFVCEIRADTNGILREMYN